MRVCAISSKACWQEPSGRWVSTGGFPLQMAGVRSLFDAMTLVVVRTSPRSGGMPLPDDAQIVPLPSPPDGLARRRLWMLRGLAGHLRTLTAAVRGADVVHVPLPGDVPCLGTLVGWLLRKRLIVRYCSSWTTTSQATTANRLIRAWIRAFAGGRRVMLATGAGQEPPAPGVSWLFASAITAGEVAAVSPDLDRPLQKPPRLALIGRLSPVKGIPCLIEALSRLRARNLLADLPQATLIGDGPQRAELEAMVRQRGLGDCVRFAGQQDRRRLVAELLQTDLCVQPSLSEGFSKALLDAMLCGVPAIATDVGANRQIVGEDGHRGWIIPKADPDLLAEAIRRRLADPIDWPALRRRCRSYVEEHTLEAWSQQIGRLCAEQWGISYVEGKLRA